MDKIAIQWATPLNAQEIRAAVERVATNLGNEYKATWRWNGGTLEYALHSALANGVSGTITATAGRVLVIVRLPLLLRPMPNAIRKGIEAELQKELGGYSA